MKMQLKKACLLYWTATYLMFVVVPIHAQDSIAIIARTIYEDPNNSSESIAAEFDINGNLKHSIAEQPGINSDGSLLFLESSSLLEELTLSDRQQLELRNCVSDWRKNHTQLKERAAEMFRQGDLQRSDLEQLASEISQCHSDGWKDVEEILLPRQVTALAQIQLRFYLRSRGILSFIQNKQIAEYVDIDRQDADRVRNIMRNGKEELANQVIEARLNATNAALASFDQEKKEKIFVKWPYLNSKDSDYAEQFRIHLLLRKGYTKREKHAENATVFERLANSPKFEMSVAGTFEPLETRRVDDRKAAEIRDFVSVFVQLYRTRDFVKVLELSDFQIEAIANAMADYSREMQQVHSMSLHFEPSGLSPADQRAEIRRIREAALGNCKEAVESTLSDKQRELLENTCGSILERKLGPFFDMRSSSLAAELGVTDSSRELMDRDFSDAEKSFEKRLCELEQEWLKKAFGALKEPARKKLMNLLGPPLMHNPPNMYVFISGK